MKRLSDVMPAGYAANETKLGNEGKECASDLTTQHVTNQDTM